MMASSYDPSLGIPYTESTEIDKPLPTANVNHAAATRRGHLFFGSICDMRTATFAVHGFNIFLKLVFIVVRHITLGAVARHPTGYISIILSSLGIFGAYTFEYLASGVAGAGFICFFLANVITFDLIGTIASGLLLYPLAVLTWELRNGIITKDNFAEEEYIEPQIREQIETQRQKISTEIGKFTGN